VKLVGSVDVEGSLANHELKRQRDAEMAVCGEDVGTRKTPDVLSCQLTRGRTEVLLASAVSNDAEERGKVPFSALELG